MRIVCDNKVRPNNTNLGLPLWSVWRVIGTIGGLKLHPYSADAEAVKHLVAGLRFKPEDFTLQPRNVVGDWVDAGEAAILPAAPRTLAAALKAPAMKTPAISSEARVPVGRNPAFNPVV